MGIIKGEADADADAPLIGCTLIELLKKSPEGGDLSSSAI